MFKPPIDGSLQGFIVLLHVQSLLLQDFTVTVEWKSVFFCLHVWIYLQLAASLFPSVCKLWSEKCNATKIFFFVNLRLICKSGVVVWSYIRHSNTSPSHWSRQPFIFDTVCYSLSLCISQTWKNMDFDQHVVDSSQRKVPGYHWRTIMFKVSGNLIFSLTYRGKVEKS